MAAPSPNQVAPAIYAMSGKPYRPCKCKWRTASGGADCSLKCSSPECNWSEMWHFLELELRLSQRVVGNRTKKNRGCTAKAAKTALRQQVLETSRICTIDRQISICLSTYLPIYLSTYVYIYLSVCLSIYLSTYPSIYPSIYLSVYRCICVSVYLCVCEQVCVCVCVCFWIFEHQWLPSRFPGLDAGPFGLTSPTRSHATYSCRGEPFRVRVWRFQLIPRTSTKGAVRET